MEEDWSTQSSWICVPLFALRSEKCTGIGEFPDLLPLIDWCRDLGLDVIQLLPLNDTGLGTSPYSGVSAFALHPLFLRLADLPLVERVPLYLDKLTKIAYWNRTERVKYHIVRELKFAFLKEYFDATFHELSTQSHYKEFVIKNRWLDPYVLFRILKEEQFWKDWERWPIQFREPDNIQALLDERKEDCDFYRFMQFHCFEQLSGVKRPKQRASCLREIFPFYSPAIVPMFGITGRSLILILLRAPLPISMRWAK